MAATPTQAEPRVRLNRDRVLRVAVELADRIGADALTMRRLAEQLGVVPMALYKHVAGREELLDGMVDVIVGEIEAELGQDAAAESPTDWRGRVRRRVLTARRTLQRHPWSRRVIETRTTKTPQVLEYLEHFTTILLEGGLSTDLAHHALHAIGGRMWGFTQELFDDSAGADASADEPAPPPDPAMLQAAAARYPGIVAVATYREHDGSTVVGRGCDDDAEFEFALDLWLDGVERLHELGWSSVARRG